MTIIFIMGGFLCLNSVSAISGACSWHGGVDCDRGADWDGSVICNDGWRDSSIGYGEADECDSGSYDPCGDRPNPEYWQEQISWKADELRRDRLLEGVIHEMIQPLIDLRDKEEELLKEWNECLYNWREKQDSYRLLTEIILCRNLYGNYATIKNGVCQCMDSYHLNAFLICIPDSLPPLILEQASKQTMTSISEEPTQQIIETPKPSPSPPKQPKPKPVIVPDRSEETNISLSESPQLEPQKIIFNEQASVIPTKPQGLFRNIWSSIAQFFVKIFNKIF